MAMRPDWESMANEAAWLNAEHMRIFGVNPGIELHCEITKVHLAQARIFRHYFEQMKEKLEQLDEAIRRTS